MFRTFSNVNSINFGILDHHSLLRLRRIFISPASDSRESRGYGFAVGGGVEGVGSPTRAGCLSKAVPPEDPGIISSCPGPKGPPGTSLPNHLRARRNLQIEPQPSFFFKNARYAHFSRLGQNYASGAFPFAVHLDSWPFPFDSESKGEYAESILRRGKVVSSI